MVGCAESGDFRSLNFRPDNADTGKFTVHATDAPFAPARRKKRNGTKQQKSQRKNVRLTPINEIEERNSILRENSFSPMSIRSDEDSIPLDSSAESSPVNTDRSRSSGYSDTGSPFGRSDTPLLRKNARAKILLNACDTFEEELALIPEDNMRDDAIRNILTDLPPRPKCKRKVLPPSFETGKPTEKTRLRRRKLLKLRNSNENDMPLAPLRRGRRGSEKHLRTEAEESAIQEIVDRCRPKSAGSGVHVVKLADLSSRNSTSVPDLPSIIDKLSHYADDQKKSSETLDDNGALSTPRTEEDNDKESTLGLVPWDKGCLKGSDMTSFYNMWERDRKKRPFGKRQADKTPEVTLYRSCMCSLKNCTKKCSGQKGKAVLPPIK